MNKKIGALLITLFMFIILTSFISATIPENIKAVTDEIALGATPILSLIVGDTPTGEFLLIKILFFIMLFAIIYSITRQIPVFSEYESLPWIISLVISIIAIRFLGTEYIVNFVWLPSGVLGIALACLVPFIIFFYFIESFDSRLIRKVGWSLYAVVYIGIAMVRWDDLATGMNTIAGGNQVPLWIANLGWIYLATATLAILSVFLDRPIRRMIIGKDAQQARANANLSERGEIRTEIKRLTTALGNAPNDKEAAKIRKRIRDLERRSQDLY